MSWRSVSWWSWLSSMALTGTRVQRPRQPVSFVSHRLFEKPCKCANTFVIFFPLLLVVVQVRMIGVEWLRWPPNRGCCRQPCRVWLRSKCGRRLRPWEPHWSCHRACQCPRQLPVFCPDPVHQRWNTLDWSTRHRTGTTRITLPWLLLVTPCWRTTRIIAVGYTLDRWIPPPLHWLLNIHPSHIISPFSLILNLSP